MPAPTYSLIFPAYNESQRIGASLEKVLAHVRNQNWDAEIIVVDDGSRDETAKIVRRYAQQEPGIHLVRNPGNRGKGYSVRNGMLHARGEILLFSDADLSSPISEAGKLLAAIRHGADVAIGSRWIRPELQTERQPKYRQLFGRVFNLLLRALLGLKFKDTQCGLKAFTRRAAQQVFPYQRIERWGFDPELLFLARCFGLRVAEVPVEWAHDERSKIHPLADGIRMFLEVLRIRWYSLTGAYSRPVVKTGREERLGDAPER
jgi:dolichyl-phosphate beta-glucosyltransferase